METNILSFVFFFSDQPAEQLLDVDESATGQTANDPSSKTGEDGTEEVGGGGGCGVSDRSGASSVKSSVVKEVSWEIRVSNNHSRILLCRHCSANPS